MRQVRDGRLMKSVRGSRKYTVADLAVDIATHDSYRVGQIYLLWRLHEKSSLREAA